MTTVPRLDFQRTPVTLILLAVAVALEVLFTLEPDARLDYYNRWLGILPHIWLGQVWRPLTSCLMHGDLIHMAFNCFWLALFGGVLEARFGSYRMLGLVVLLGYVSILPEYVVGSYRRGEPTMIVGLSGIVYGLFGLIFIGRRYVREWWEVCDQQTVNLLIGWFFLCIVLTAYKIMLVANIAHGAGFGFGVLYGLVVFDKPRRGRWLALSVVLTLLVLSTMVACPGHVQYEAVRRSW